MDGEYPYGSYGFIWIILELVLRDTGNWTTEPPWNFTDVELRHIQAWRHGAPRPEKWMRAFDPAPHDVASMGATPMTSWWLGKNPSEKYESIGMMTFQPNIHGKIIQMATIHHQPARLSYDVMDNPIIPSEKNGWNFGVPRHDDLGHLHMVNGEGRKIDVYMSASALRKREKMGNQSHGWGHLTLWWFFPSLCDPLVDLEVVPQTVLDQCGHLLGFEGLREKCALSATCVFFVKHTQRIWQVISLDFPGHIPSATAGLLSTPTSSSLLLFCSHQLSLGGLWQIASSFVACGYRG